MAFPVWAHEAPSQAFIIQLRSKAALQTRKSCHLTFVIALKLYRGRRYKDPLSDGGADFLMPRNKPVSGQTCPEAFQTALDALDVIGRWEWDAATDLARVDAFVALLFNVDPSEAEEGLPLSFFVDGVHPEDRQRVLELIRSSANASSAYLTEYRVISVDGRTRWVLARGRFTSDYAGRPQSGSGILIDITQMRMREGTFEGVKTCIEGTPLDRAADHAIAAQQAIVDLQDPHLKVFADALLMEVGRRLAREEVRERRKRMN